MLSRLALLAQAFSGTTRIEGHDPLAMHVHVNRLRLALAGGTLLAAFLLTGAPASAAATVTAFPSPGARVASPQTQIVFRGVSYGRLWAASIRVTGSRSGVHAGMLAADSDGHGGSFLPTSPFTGGETVTGGPSQRRGDQLREADVPRSACSHLVAGQRQRRLRARSRCRLQRELRADRDCPRGEWADGRSA